MHQDEISFDALLTTICKAVPTSGGYDAAFLQRQFSRGNLRIIRHHLKRGNTLGRNVYFDGPNEQEQYQQIPERLLLLVHVLDRCLRKYYIHVLTSDAVELREGTLYLRNIQGKLVYSMIDVNGVVIKNATINDIRPPSPFTIENLYPLKRNILQAILNQGHALLHESEHDALLQLRQITANLIQSFNAVLNCYTKIGVVQGIISRILETLTPH